jgi:hypothetical protein
MASGVRLKKEMTASELVVVPGGGHVVFEEMPEDSNRIMLDWLRRDPVSSTLAASERGSLGSRLREQALTVPVAARTRTSAAIQHLSPGT